MPCAKFVGKFADSNDDWVIPHHPPSSVSFRFRSLLVLASVGDMLACVGDDVGRSYLETQQAMGQICGENIPILMMLGQFPSHQ